MPIPIEVLWEELHRDVQRPVFRRVDEKHDLDLFGGLDINDGRVLMLVTPEQPPAPAAYDVINVESRHRADGAWVLLITLKTTELAIPFARLCQDLIDATRGCKSDGAKAILVRLARWHRLLGLAKNEALSEPALRGLIGELLVLRDKVLPQFGTAGAVNSWVGPHEAPQDFVVGGIALEVKTSSPAATSIRISSLQQLEAQCPLYLANVHLTPSSQAQPKAFTPAQIVANIRDLLGESTPLRAEFDLLLVEAGYQDLPIYEDKWYQSDGTHFYAVSAHVGFPRLTTASVPSGIVSAAYEIALSGCTPFEIMENALWT